MHTNNENVGTPLFSLTLYGNERTQANSLPLSHILYTNMHTQTHTQLHTPDDAVLINTEKTWKQMYTKPQPFFSQKQTKNKS